MEKCFCHFNGYEVKDAAARKQLSDLSGKEAVLESRLNGLTKLAEGSTTGDAELLDARVGYDSTIYDNVGEAIRRQIDGAHDHARTATGFVRRNLITKMNVGFVSGSSINEATEDTLYRYTNPIFLEAGETVYATNVSSTYGTNTGAHRWIDGEIIAEKKTPNISETDAYFKYNIPETGYYVFNTRVSDGVVTKNACWMKSLVLGVYLPDDILNPEKITERLDVIRRKNLIKKLNPGFLRLNDKIWVISDVESETFRYTDPIFFEAGTTVYHTDVSGTYGVNARMLQTNRDMTWFGWFDEGTAGAGFKQYTVPYDGWYVFNTLENTCVTTKAEWLNEKPGCELPDDLKYRNDSLKGKKATFNGDSICYGAGKTGGYAKIISEEFGLEYQNIAVSGGTITADTYYDDGDPRHWICRTIENMDADADFAICEGGANDASLSSTPFGIITDGYTEELDDTTFCGAMESICKQLVTRFAGKKVGFILVHKMARRYSSEYTGADNFYSAAKRICEKWGVPVLDLNVKCPPLNYIEDLKMAYTRDGDGWHPNEAGYKAYYVPKIAKWLESL